MTDLRNYVHWEFYRQKNESRETEKKKEEGGMHYRRTQIVCIYKFKDASAGSSALREQSKDEGKWSVYLKKKQEKKSSYLQ